MKMPGSKRAFDVAIASMTLLFLFPFLLLVIIAIRLESKGTVIFKVKRIGRVPFNLYKFRSMFAETNGELNTFPQEPNDINITKVGKFIRNTGIDKWPQLINVILGDMSIVGNQPLTEYEAERLSVGEDAQRLLAPAGIISLAEVAQRTQGKMISENERKRLDNAYADHFTRDNYSLMFDLKLIIMRINTISLFH
jgi:lipopolysaccharide/colanic/teichoic acid biosynthesis glycosyltransferase